MRKFKGFTLIELIVVLATFSIIMFGALSLMTPVSKMMVQADVHEGASAAATNITRYLEQELSGAEYLYAGNGLLTPEKREQYLKDYVTDYYEGVLKAGSTPESPNYAGGKIHLLMIDNTKDAKISRYTYEYESFGITDNPTYKTPVEQVEYAVNKAYYDDYDFEIQVGSYDDLTAFDNAVINGNFLVSGEGKIYDSIAFTVKTTANANHTDYHFLTSTAFPLVNPANRSGVYPEKNYYVITQKKVTVDGTTEKIENSIIDIADADASSQKYASPDYELCRHKWNAKSVNIFPYSTSGVNPENNKDGYWFIYSYGSEIKTQDTP